VNAGNLCRANPNAKSQSTYTSEVGGPSTEDYIDRVCSTLKAAKTRAGLFVFQAGNASARRFGTLPRRRAREKRTFTELMELSKQQPREAYAASLYEFRTRVPDEVREHRNYFKASHRSFGEDAFHGVWWLMCQERRPRRALEIGVYRGQAISLWALIAQVLAYPCAVHGISPLEAVGDSVSAYPDSFDYETDIRSSFEQFGLAQPVLVRALSTDLPAVEHVTATKWDVVYVDGSHDYHVVKEDVAHAWDALAPAGILVMDDAALFLNSAPFKGAFMGHDGPSRVARELEDGGQKRLGSIGHMVFFQKPGEHP
jgi:hypothetical protein